jgi:solute carrier family 9 (sodium/hydrogen exchanger), member 6/7
MSRRTQLTTKYLFQVLAQLSENFIFIYLGLTLFTETNLVFKPLFILVTTVGICVSRWLSVFPLSKAINWFLRYKAKRQGKEVVDELPWPYQAMLFWAGLRGAVGIALAAGLEGNNGPALRATVLLVVILTVIIFGGTTARMLEILGIRTGVVEEIDSDDEFDIETANGGTYYKRSGTGFGHTPKPSIGLDFVTSKPNGTANTQRTERGYSSSNRHSPPADGQSVGGVMGRKNSNLSSREREREAIEQSGNLLSHISSTFASDDEDAVDLDLPPAAPRRKPSPLPGGDMGQGRPGIVIADHDANDRGNDDVGQSHPNPSGSIRDLLRGAATDHTAWFRQLDEDYIKPTLLLDQHQGHGRGGA